MSSSRGKSDVFKTSQIRRLQDVVNPTSVVVNRFIYDTFIRPHGKPKHSFPQYPFLTIFFVKNSFYGNEDLDLVILHSYMILEYDLKHLWNFRTLLYDFWTLSYDLKLSSENSFPIDSSRILSYDPKLSSKTHSQ